MWPKVTDYEATACPYLTIGGGKLVYWVLIMMHDVS